jgi:hypothetical protein
MAKKKRGQNNTPRRKRFNRRQRLDSARNWLPTYDGGNIAKAYRKHYSVDWPTAFRELAMLGVEIDPEYKEQVLESVRGQAEARKRRRKEKAAQAEGMLQHCQDENFAYIVGYTNWGFPYGVTWEEWEEMETSELEGLEPENTGTNSHR